MSREKSNTAGLVLLVIVILVAILFVTPVWRFSCSRVFMHDFLGMDHVMTAPGVFFTTTNFVRLVPLIVMLVLWAAVALWVYHDAERRGQSGVLWGLFVFVGNIIGLIVYLILRVSSPEIAGGVPGATTKCPNCSGTIRSTYVACPYCGIKLSKHCNNCGKPVEPDWKACPHCGQRLGDSPSPPG
jgi:hypothetical protein